MILSAMPISVLQKFKRDNPPAESVHLISCDISSYPARAISREVSILQTLLPNISLMSADTRKASLEEGWFRGLLNLRAEFQFLASVCMLRSASILICLNGPLTIRIRRL